MFDRYQDRVLITEIDANEPVENVVTSSSTTRSLSPEPDRAEIGSIVANPRACNVVVSTWHFHPDLIDRC